MKKIFLLVSLLFAITTVFAQTLYTRKDTILITQDSVTLQTGKFRGAIQWQYSTDKKTWNNLNGKIKETLKVIKSAEGYYRAEIIDHNCTPLYSDTAQIKSGFNISKTITAQAGGSITTPDNSRLTIPASALQTDGKVSISSVEENELPAIANPNLQRFGASYKIEIPGDTLLHNVTLTITLDTLPDPIENYVLYLYNGNSYFPIEYKISGNTVTALVDNINWEKNSTSIKNATVFSELLIMGLVLKQTPPVEEMGLKEVQLSGGKLSFSVPTAISDTSKVLLLIHGWIDTPQTWASFVQKITSEKNIRFSQIWTFGYNSSWSIDENASKLSQALATYTNGAKVRIVAHSMGGLVSRSMIEYYGGAKYVKKLITLGTPHLGSPVAALRYVLGVLVTSDSGIIGTVVYDYMTQGFRDLFVGSEFIAKMRNTVQSPVPYYCIAGISSKNLPLVPGLDDGVVGVESALGAPKIKASATINMNSLIAHLDLPKDETVFKRTKEYLMDHDTILVVSGNKQSGSPAAKLAQPVVVQVQDEAKKPVKNKPVFFAFTQGLLARFGLKSAQVDLSENKPDTLSLETDEEGKISLDWTLGKNVGDQEFEAFLKDDGDTKIDSIKITATACGCDTTRFGHFTDPRDGHVYKTIKIGSQIWMAENLAYLPYSTDTLVKSLNESCYYSNSKSVFYNWPAAKKACPLGWHLPSDKEWLTLADYLGGMDIAGGKMKSCSTGAIPNVGATNESNFSALLNGGFNAGYGGYYLPEGYGGRWWSSTEYNDNRNASLWYVGCTLSSLGRIDGGAYMFYGCSVRCVNDNVTSDIPFIMTLAPSAIQANTANSSGKITSDGGATVTSRGVCWNTTGTPTINDNKTIDGTGIGTFTSTLAGLTPCTTYYVRAYATNSEGTAYGNQVTFTTLADKLPCLKTKEASAITDRSATCGGEITNEGDSPVTIRGVCWNTKGSPTIGDLITNEGGGTGNFNSNLISLQNNTKYYLRAYATNAQGTAYGNEVTFTTLKENIIPEATTHGITDITATSATCGGTVINNNGSEVTARGICWNTTGNPTTGDSKTTDGAGDGNFISKMTGLAPNTKYYIRAYATNKNGTGYGGQVFFITNKE